jgi:hypothetical protein
LFIVAFLGATACGRSSETPPAPEPSNAEPPSAPVPAAAPVEPPDEAEPAPAPVPTPDEDVPAKPVDEMSEAELEAACFQGRQEACDLLGE